MPLCNLPKREPKEQKDQKEEKKDKPKRKQKSLPGTVEEIRGVGPEEGAARARGACAF